MEEGILDTLENDSAIPEEVQEKLSKLLERYQQMSDEEKEEFRNGAFDVLKKTLHMLPKNSILPTWLAPYQSYILFIIAVLIVLFPFVILTVKLYKRTRARELRQEEKKKLKQKKTEMRNKKKE